MLSFNTLIKYSVSLQGAERKMPEVVGKHLRDEMQVLRGTAGFEQEDESVLYCPVAVSEDPAEDRAAAVRRAMYDGCDLFAFPGFEVKLRKGFQNEHSRIILMKIKAVCFIPNILLL
jgi:hypothetical protein